MKKTIFIMALSAISLIACTKDADIKVAEEQTFTPEKNAFRAVQIEGNNEIWGDYVLKLTYKNDKIETCVREDIEGDTLGTIRFSRNLATEYTLTVNDFVVSIDADSIQRLDEKFKVLYGAGNYSLKDSLPRSSQTLMRMTVNLLRDGRISRQAITYFAPRKDVGVGEDFAYAYIQDRRETLLYEYDEEGRVCNCRQFQDIFDPQDAQIYTRSLYKEEYLYSGKHLTEIILLEAKNGENFIEYDRYTYQRHGDQIESIGSNNGAKTQFVWTNDVLSSIQYENGTTNSYTWDGNGYVTGLKTPKNNVTKVVYEAGHGNLSWIIPLRDLLHETPNVK